jgi:hypothetical protein
VALERRLPRPLLGLHACLGPELRGGRLLVLVDAFLLLGGAPLGARHPAHQVGHPPYAVAAGPRRVRRSRGGGDPARRGGDLDAGGGGGVGERGDAGEDGGGAGGHGGGRVGDRGRERRGVGREALGERRGGPGGHGARGGREAREVAAGAPLRARRGRQPRGVAAAQRGARLGLQRGQRDQRLAEAAVRVGEAEEVVQEPLREAGPAQQAAQRLPHLRVAQQLRERDEHPAHLRRRRGHGRRRRRRRGRAGRGLADHEAQRGHVVVQLQQQRVEAAGEAGRPDAVRRQLVARGRQSEGVGSGLRGRERDGAAVPGHRAWVCCVPLPFAVGRDRGCGFYRWSSRDGRRGLRDDGCVRVVLAGLSGCRADGETKDIVSAVAADLQSRAVTLRYVTLTFSFVF